jgi:pimeloyl-ACP methyl ester carboxylesterase
MAGCIRQYNRATEMSKTFRWISSAISSARSFQNEPEFMNHRAPTQERRIVFLHALPLDDKQWREESEFFAGEVYAPRLYAFGESLLEWARGVLDVLGSRERFIVVGNSIGGSCALEMARLAPNQIDALVLAGTKAAHRPEPEFCKSFISALERDPPTIVRRWVDDLLSSKCPASVRERVHLIAQSQPV